MKRVLITGGCGFIGRHLVKTLSRNGYQIMVIDDLSNSQAFSSLDRNVSFLKANILDNEVESVYASFSPEIVFHLAAQISVTQSVKEPLRDASSNIQGTIRLLELAKRYSSQKFIMSSSGGALYGECDGAAASETSLIKPESPYGLSKHCAEKYLLWFGEFTELSVVSLRFANVYGPGQGEGGEAGVISLFSRRMMAGEDIYIYGDGTQSRDFVYVSCVVDSLIRASQDISIGGIFNIGSGEALPISSLVHDMSRLLRFSGKKIFKASRQGEIKHSRLDCSKANALLGWFPQVQINEGLQRVANSLHDTGRHFRGHQLPGTDHSDSL